MLLFERNHARLSYAVTNKSNAYRRGSHSKAQALTMLLYQLQNYLVLAINYIRRHAFPVRTMYYRVSAAYVVLASR